MNKLTIKLTQWIIRRYLPESIYLDDLIESPAYIQALGFVKEAEKTKSAGIHKRDFARAHLFAWYQKNSISRPKDLMINLMIELAIWRSNKWT